MRTNLTHYALYESIEIRAEMEFNQKRRKNASGKSAPMTDIQAVFKHVLDKAEPLQASVPSDTSLTTSALRKRKHD